MRVLKLRHDGASTRKTAKCHQGGGTRTHFAILPLLTSTSACGLPLGLYAHVGNTCYLNPECAPPQHCLYARLNVMQSRYGSPAGLPAAREHAWQCHPNGPQTGGHRLCKCVAPSERIEFVMQMGIMTAMMPIGDSLANWCEF